MTAVPKMAEPDQLRSTAADPIDPQIWLDPEDYPNVEHLITEDDTPLDNLFVAKQQRLLVESLYGSLLFAEAVARAQQFDSRRFVSLAAFFGVSARAMAIRLEELKLVAPYLYA